MKYRHSFHAGNFADVHKHVTLLALLGALKRKEKGFAYLETHAGKARYDLSAGTEETAAGIGRYLSGGSAAEPELTAYTSAIEEWRTREKNRHFYPGSPLLAAHELRSVDRAILCEIVPAEARVLEKAVEPFAHVRVERGDGFERLRAWLPPPERRGLIFIDPPYEETRQDFDRVTRSVGDAVHRFQTGVIAVWYPIKEERETAKWVNAVAAGAKRETLLSEFWLYPRDSRVALNGSGMLIVNPPYLFGERTAAWLPELQARLDVGRSGGTSVRTVV
ncbi:MAG TPA: 23S rRNA (adenine(2030)-N(6))-methyltransferase RlmJ [Steroidobacteraceae bacterium]|jgi:23S rRNA (adenine2030-N6)-methyltransferase